MKRFSDYVNRESKGKGLIRKNLTGQFRICKRDICRHRVFGYAITGTKKGIEIQGHTITVQDMEISIYEYIREMRNRKDTDPVTIIESCVFTREKQNAMGIPPGILPQFAYWIGFEIHDPAIWEMFRQSNFPVFSIEITGNVE